MNEALLKLLACPSCKQGLQYRADEQELVCTRERLAFPVRDGIPVLLLMDARALDAPAAETSHADEP